MKISQFHKQLMVLSDYLDDVDAKQIASQVKSIAGLFDGLGALTFAQFTKLFKKAEEQYRDEQATRGRFLKPAGKTAQVRGGIDEIIRLQKLFNQIKAPKAFSQSLSKLAVLLAPYKHQELAFFTAQMNGDLLQIHEKQKRKSDASKGKKKASKADIDGYVARLNGALNNRRAYDQLLDELAAPRTVTVSDLRIILQKLIGGSYKSATKKRCLEILRRHYQDSALDASRGRIISGTAA